MINLISKYWWGGQVKKERIISGIPGLDIVLKGGFLTGRAYLIVGTAGTGKTIFSIQFLREGRRKGEKGSFHHFSRASSRFSAQYGQFRLEP